MTFLPALAWSARDSYMTHSSRGRCTTRPAAADRRRLWVSVRCSFQRACQFLLEYDGQAVHGRNPLNWRTGKCSGVVSIAALPGGYNKVSGLLAGWIVTTRTVGPGCRPG